MSNHKILRGSHLTVEHRIEKLRILVCGGRSENEQKVVEYLAQFLSNIEVTTIIHGAAPGADTGADIFARLYSIPTEVFHADWKNLNVIPCVKRKSMDGGFYNAAAGAIRNEKMATEGAPDLVIAFPGGPGTKNMIDIAKKHSIMIFCIPESYKENKKNGI